MRLTTKWGSHPCKLTHLASNYDKAQLLVQELRLESLI